MGARAFDTQRPPQLELIESCVHCGFCLPTCPTYVPLWNEEMDSPRGRIVLMAEGLEESSSLSDAMVQHFDRCLGCMACVTACPSGVRYDLLLAATRAQVERNAQRPAAERLYRRLLFAIFTHPGRMHAAAPLLALAQRTGLARALARTGPPRLRALARLATEARPSASLTHVPERIAHHRPRARVGLLLGCVQRVFFHQVNAATARVLDAEGYEVRAPRRPRCCGALQFHSGEEPAARSLAKETIDAFAHCDFVAVNAAGCGSAMREYGFLLADEPEWAERAAAFSAKVRDVTELLAEAEPRAERQPLPMRVAYHDACHLAHAQRVRAQPRSLLRAIPELELVEPREWELCCGSAGLYNLLQPEPAAELGRRKAANLLATDPEAITAANPGCVLQIGAYLAEMARPLPIHHPVELIDASIRGRTP